MVVGSETVYEFRCLLDDVSGGYILCGRDITMGDFDMYCILVVDAREKSAEGGFIGRAFYDDINDFLTRHELRPPL